MWQNCRTGGRFNVYSRAAIFVTTCPDFKVKKEQFFFSLSAKDEGQVLSHNYVSIMTIGLESGRNLCVDIFLQSKNILISLFLWNLVLEYEDILNFRHKLRNNCPAICRNKFEIYFLVFIVKSISNNLNKHFPINLFL